ncbi:nucleotide sugar dehydrogenase [Firmicutes bacterium CAG:582]|nr:nucleotide sugar dehydrogenase [Firmicutes bacterium CAG:582]
MKIAVAGCGYVGLSLSTLLSQKHEVVALDIDEKKVDKINKRKCPIKDKLIEEYFKEKDLNLKATIDAHEAINNADFVIISTPTNYDDKTNYFDTSAVEDIIVKTIEFGSQDTTIVVKSTIPVGFIDHMKEKYNIDNILFSPEFLREGHALEDNLYPSRIIVGSKSKKAKLFAELLKDAALKEDVQVLCIGGKEAEAVKLFANTYLALRVSFFNELDTYADVKGLKTKDIIDGVCLDPRIGSHYNNPSFGYGGYCLPKDTKQLLANYEDIPENLIGAIIKSNDTRKKYISDSIKKKKPLVVGAYRLAMKAGSDNFRTSAIKDIIESIKNDGINVVIYEPTIDDEMIMDCPVIKNLNDFKKMSDIILVNRLDENLMDSLDRVYTRDVYSNN